MRVAVGDENYGARKVALFRSPCINRTHEVVLDEEAGKIEVVVPEEQLSLAIGRRGQNVRLASQLTNLDIDINRIYPNPDQPRKFFNEESLKELSESIKSQGVLVPILKQKKIPSRFQ